MFNLVKGKEGLPIVVLSATDYNAWLATQPEHICNWLVHSGFSGNGHTLVPNSNGNVAMVLVVCEHFESHWVLAEVAKALPAGAYYLDAEFEQQQRWGLGWVLGQYQFSRYKAADKRATLYVSDDRALNSIARFAKAVYLTRDMVNTPASDMMPQDIAKQMQTLAAEFDAQFSEVVGDQLLAENYPTIHMVGRASVNEPRLLDLTWGDANAPKLTLVGKGVCFDSGGLDLKSAASMRLMKKDMGGAAHVLGLAALIMAFKLPVRLRVLVPAVENAVSGDAFRPGDIVTTRKGLSVEIDNTDAEGRLVLCDALAEADAESPDLIIDFATLTGAARVALGLEVPVFYSTCDEVALALTKSGQAQEDDVWRLPLHQPYGDYMKGKISDLVNCAPTPFGGSITAALYLQHFVEKANWVHFDVGAWNDRARAGRPAGGEAMGIRAVFDALTQRYQG